MTALYNEIEPYAAAWLRNLSDAGHIAHGSVDGRSIAALSADDVAGAVQFHTFAGIGAWSYALRLAGWPDDRPVWTGSCPCQPFSNAGKRRGTDDERHLWPEWFRLIRECRPPVVFGEQVASADGRAWLAAVRADLEAVGYRVGAADLCAAGVGAPHIRQRLFFGAVRVADADEGKWGWLPNGKRRIVDGASTGRQQGNGELERSIRTRGLADRPEHGRRQVGTFSGGCGERGDDGEERAAVERAGGVLGRVEHSDAGRFLDPVHFCKRGEGVGASQLARRRISSEPWSSVEWLPCRDGKARPTQPGLFPLAHGATARVGRLRAYGNAIVPQVAAGFVVSFMQAVSDTR